MIQTATTQASDPASVAPAKTSGAEPASRPELPQAVTLGPVVQHADGSQTIALQLHPASLGRVSVTIERATQDATPRIVVAAEKPATLAMLTHDSGTLQQVLDQAGVPREGRSVSFQAAMPEAAPTHAAPHAELAPAAPQTPNASADPNASQQRDQRGGTRRPRTPVPTAAVQSAGAPAFAGNIDITA
ncbi:MAG TPA: flagellar hook-length control protein FliK [Acidisphaera sp.]|nr:flagellar hook-length control protein FliK [Acidisphaera sp.]